MNKNQLIVAVANSTGMKQTEAKNIVETFSNIISSTLLAGEEVTLPRIGKLKVSDRPARTGRNPKTGEAIQIPAKQVVKFKPSSEFGAGLVESEAVEIALVT